MAQLMAHLNLAVWQLIPAYAWLYEVVDFILTDRACMAYLNLAWADSCVCLAL